MTKENLGISLGTVFADIARNDEIQRAKTEEENRLSQEAHRLNIKARELLDEYGRPLPTNRAPHAERDYPAGRATPPVETEAEGQTVSLQLVQDLSYRPAYDVGGRIGARVPMRPYTKGYEINAAVGSEGQDTISQERRLFYIKEGQHEVQNWLGEKATLEQMGVASQILSHIEQSLAAQAASQPPRERFPWTKT